MIIELDKPVEALDPLLMQNDALPSQALWIKVAPYPEDGRSKYRKTVQTVEYRTPDGNTLVNIDVDHQGASLGIEIFP